jgi:CRISPR-associated protein Cas5t
VKRKEVKRGAGKMEILTLLVEAPFCSFRPHTSRDYQDTYPFPPPSTVFGMLLSLAGVDWPEKRNYVGVKMSLALEREPGRARVLRKLRRVPQNSKGSDSLAARRPDYQELLIDVRLWVWLDQGKEQPSEESLLSLIRIALSPIERHAIARFGGLSLGESSNLVNEIVLNPSEVPRERLQFLVLDPKGYFSLPIWVDHPRSGKNESIRKRFDIKSFPFETPPSDDPRWITIEPRRQ